MHLNIKTIFKNIAAASTTIYLLFNKILDCKSKSTLGVDG